MEANSQFHAPVVLTPGEELWCLFNRRLRGLQYRHRRFGEDRIILTLPGTEPRFLGCQAHSLGTRFTEMSRFFTSEVCDYQRQGPTLLTLIWYHLVSRSFPRHWRLLEHTCVSPTDCHTACSPLPSLIPAIFSRSVQH